MAKQPELVLEEQLVGQLQKLGYGLVYLKDENELISNLKSQLEKHNNIQFSDKEFDRVMNILSKGSVFEKAKSLREKQHIIRDNGDNLYFEFIPAVQICFFSKSSLNLRNYKIFYPAEYTDGYVV